MAQFIYKFYTCESSVPKSTKSSGRFLRCKYFQMVLKLFVVFFSFSAKWHHNSLKRKDFKLRVYAAVANEV